MVVKMIETPRLILRQWRDTDYLPFAEMSANPEVMRYFPKVLTRAESNAYIDKLKAIIQKQGWGFWAAEFKET
jgi:ribosomal-protein-alanine N-acetyltransferase